MNLQFKKRVVGLTILCASFLFIVDDFYPNPIIWLGVTVIGLILWLDGTINE